MATLIELAKKASKELKVGNPRTIATDTYDHHNRLIHELDAAIEQAEKVEPVAWMMETTHKTTGEKCIWISTDRKGWTGMESVIYGEQIPLYANPAPAVPKGWKLVPIEPTDEMVDQGAQGMAVFQENSVWPDSWDKTQVWGMCHDARKAWRYMLAAVPEAPK